MSFFSPDLLDMLDVFQQEMLQLNNELSQILLGVEVSKIIALDDINAIFRIVHTVKSSSAMMGLTEMSEYAHKLEDQFQTYRQLETLSSSQNEQALDLIYDFQLFLENELSNITSDDYSPAKPNYQFKEQKEEVEPAKPINQQSNSPLKLHITFVKNCPMKAVRAFMLVRDIKKYVNITSTIPVDLEASDATSVIDEEGLIINFESSNLYNVEEILKKDKNIEKYEIINNHKKVDKEIINQQFTNIKWRNISELKDCIGELLVAYSYFQNQKELLGNPKELDEFDHSYLRIVKNLDKISQSISMLSIKTITPQLFRTVREIAKKQNKEIELIVHGDDIELDKKLLDTLNKPFIHILRNAVDHGIESLETRIKKGKDSKGIIKFSVENDGGIITITIKDDGKGMNTQKILEVAKQKGMLTKPESEYTKQEILRFAVTPGFSTNNEANEFSGRGVGMDVVVDTLDKIGGTLVLNSVEDEGTSIIMKIPVASTSLEGIQVKAGEYTCILPVRQVKKVFSYYDEDKIVVKDDCKFFNFGDELLPVVDLCEILNTVSIVDNCFYLILEGLKYQICLKVDMVMGQEIVVEKSLPPLFTKEYRHNTGITGCVMFGNGEIGYMLNTDAIYRINVRR